MTVNARYPILTTVLLMACVAGGLLVAQAPAPPTPERVGFDQWLQDQATRALADRRARTTSLTTTAAVEARQREVRTALADAMGVLPASTAPLAATVTKTTARDGYRIEHLLFESLPGLKVTGLVYVPDGAGPFPAVLGTAGHANEGKASPTYQHVWVSLARRGFVVLAYDPPGQGERYEYVDAAGSSTVGAGTREHMMTGQQVLLTGRTIAAYMAHDGRRALDYLLTRPDVDPARIAIAGNSGGGTQAALVGAVEPRLAAVVVSCYMTSWSHMWVTPGPQDSEQILPGFLTRGLDFADFAVTAAPRGYLVSSAIQDYFPIAGSRQASTELATIYGALGASDKLARVENDATHGWTQPLREGAYLALGRWLGRPGQPVAEAPVTTEPIEALRVTTTGQLATSVGSRTVRAINADEARSLAASRPAVTDAGLRALVGDLAARPAPRVVSRSGEAASADGERMLVDIEPGVRVRARLRRGTDARGPAVLIVDERGATSRDATIDALVSSGHTVLAMDVRGTGDLAPAAGASGYSAAYQFAARAWLLGTSVVAWQAQDIHAGLALLRAEAPSAARRVVQASGQTVPAALIAAQHDRPDALILEEGLVSYLDLATADTHDQTTLSVLPGVLRVTDLPELMARLAPTPVRVVRPRGADSAPLTTAQVAARAGRALPANVTVEP